MRNLNYPATYLSRLVMLVTAALFLTGCASFADRGTGPKLDLGNAKADIEDELFAPERAHLSKAKKPKIGLALSGGGTKAAVFAHGVLHGLNDAGVLPHVDVISSVSGGSYTAMWYFTKHIEANRHKFDVMDIFKDCWPEWRLCPSVDSLKEDWLTYKRLFEIAKLNEAVSCPLPTHIVNDDPFRFQAHLARYPDLFRTEYTPQTSNEQDAPIGESLGLLANVVFELLVGWMNIDTGLIDAYQAGIERTWGLSPQRRAPNAPDTKDAWSFTNISKSETVRYHPRMDAGSATFADLRALYKDDSAPPMWVLQATIGSKGDLPNMDTLYEISPFIQGSSHPGAHYESTPEKFAPQIQQIPTAVRASAAFADSQGVKPGLFKSLMVGITNHLLPSSRWGVDIPLTKGTARLSDGGGSDNLGLMSLVRRRLTDIIIADSAEDQKGTMDDLCWAQKALAQEEMTMEFEGLENFDRICKYLFDSSDPSNKLAYNISMWLNPVVMGTITNNATGRKTNLWLIKPAWNQQAIRAAYNKNMQCKTAPGSIPCGLILHYANNTEYKTPRGDYMEFPQDGTVSAVLNFSSYKLAAYRELGRYNAGHLKIEAGRLAVDKPQKIQPSYKRSRARPGPSMF